MSLDREKFDLLDKEANRAYEQIQEARNWIDSLIDRASCPDLWRTISAELDGLLSDIVSAQYQEQKALEKKEQNQ